MKTKIDKTEKKADKPLTWEKLVRAEPALAGLLDYARNQQRTIVAYRECGEINLHVYRAIGCYRNVIKPNVEYLVGWGRAGGPAFLKTRQAYKLVVDTLWAALPDDFDDDEVAEAYERACEYGLDEDEHITLIGPKAA